MLFSFTVFVTYKVSVFTLTVYNMWVLFPKLKRAYIYFHLTTFW